MGLTGLISEATMRLRPIETSMMRVDSERAPDLDTAMARMAEADDDYRYSVAWLDCLARGPLIGRSLLEFADHARLDDLPAEDRRPERALRFEPPGPARGPALGAVTAAQPLDHHRLQRAVVPQGPPPGGGTPGARPLLLPPSRHGRRLEPHLRPAGFLQYQMVVPDGAEATLRRSIEALSGAQCASFLAVLKRFGPANPAPLSFPDRAGRWPSTCRRPHPAWRPCSTGWTSGW